MHKARILIVDDSAVIRRLLADALAADPAIEIAGTAANGRIALQKIEQLRPDLVTLDLEMPEMDGLATLGELKNMRLRPPVIIFSTLTERGAVATLSALSLGAADYVTKPANVGGVPAAIQAVRRELIPKIKSLCRLEAGQTASPQAGKVAPPMPRGRGSANLRLQRFDCLAIGVSTGGPTALAEMFRELPAEFPIPIVVVQHMPPLFTRHLAERLSSISALDVREAQMGDVLLPGGAWVAPGNFHMSLSRGAAGTTIQLHQDPPENSCRPAVDVLFRSVAQAFGSASLGLVLTGMGQDGLRGCQAIVGAGGRVVVQDEATSVVWGMPRAVASAGLADLILPLPKLAVELTQLAQQRRVRPLMTQTATSHA